MKLNISIYHAKMQSLALSSHKNSQWLRCSPSCGRLELKLLPSFTARSWAWVCHVSALSAKLETAKSLSSLCILATNIWLFIQSGTAQRREIKEVLLPNIQIFTALFFYLNPVLSLLWVRQSRTGSSILAPKTLFSKNLLETDRLIQKLFSR